MFEATYRGLERTKKTQLPRVLPEHVEPEAGEPTQVPTELERAILNELSKGRLTPSDLAERLDKKAPSIVKALSSMVKSDWVGRVGQGKRAYYHIT